MQRVKQAAEVYKLYPKLRLGEKLPKGGVKPTGPHTIKITAEPTTTAINKNGKTVKAFKFIVDEGGKLYKWLVPLTNEDGTEGHYLIDRLQDIEIGQEIVLEMKKRGAKNYIDVSLPGDADDEEVPVTDEDDPARDDEGAMRALEE